MARIAAVARFSRSIRCFGFGNHVTADPGCTVISFFDRWMIRFPTIEILADASLDDVLKLWEVLGYYSQARNLHAAVKIVMEPHSITVKPCLL